MGAPGGSVKEPFSNMQGRRLDPLELIASPPDELAPQRPARTPVAEGDPFVELMRIELTTSSMPFA
jgi:hypothetical protein